jgi:hypothetical protein
VISLILRLWPYSETRERVAFEGCFAGISEKLSAVATPDAGTGVLGLDGSIVTLWTGCLLPGLLTAPFDFIIERLWSQHH